MIIWLQFLFCERRGTIPCQNCSSCRKIRKREAEWILFIEPELERLKLSDAERALEFLGLEKISAARFVVINEAHALSAAASAVLLKALEEPPPNTHFILLTKSPWLLLPTIRSRLVHIQLAPPGEKRLEEANPKTPSWMIQISQGRPVWLNELKTAPNLEIVDLLCELFQERHLRETQGLVGKKVMEFFAPKEHLSIKIFWGYIILKELSGHAQRPRSSFLFSLTPRFESLAKLCLPVVNWLGDWVEVERRIQRGFGAELVFEAFCFGGFKDALD